MAVTPGTVAIRVFSITGEDGSMQTLPAPSRNSFARRLDARIKLALLLASCFVSQYLPENLLPFWLGLLGLLFLLPETRSGAAGSMLRGGLFFTLFWLMMKTGSDMFGGKEIVASLVAGLPLAGRLLALTLIGAVFTAVASPLAIGRAVAWYLSPALGRKAWKPALAIALTAWFLPQTLRVIADILAAMRARGLRLSWRRKAFLLAGALLRILERRADELAVGLASRGLDDSRSFLVR